MYRFTLGLFLVFSVALISCGGAPAEPPGEPGTSAAADEAVLRADVARWYEAFHAEDAAALAALYTDDAIVVPAGQPMRQGRDAIQAGFEAEFAVTDCRISSELLEVVVHGDVAYMSGRDTSQCTSAEGESTTSPPTRWIAIALRQADGSWKLHRDVASEGAAVE